MHPGAQNSKKILAVVVLFIVPLAVYFNTLSNGFVHDDHHMVEANEWITDIRYLAKILVSSEWSFVEGEPVSNYYRPTIHLVYMALYHITGPEPWVYHLTNVLLHALNAVMVFLIAFSLMSEAKNNPPGRSTPALPDTLLSSGYLYPGVAALIFAVNPMNNEAVSWVASMSDPLFTLFSLLAFYIYLKAGEGGYPWVLLSVTCFFLALLSKETAVVLPLVIAAYDYSVKGLPFVRNWRRYLAYAAAAALYMGIRVLVFGGAVHHKTVDMTMYELMINVPTLFVRYMGKFIVPLNLTAVYVFDPVQTVFEPRMIGAVVFTVLYGTALILLRRKTALFVSLLLIVIPLAPSLYIPAISPGAFAERYFYLPSVGLAMVISIAFRGTVDLISKFNGARVNAYALIVLVSVAVVIGLYTIGTINRSAVWKDDYTLWKDTVKKASEDADVQYNYALALHKRGDTSKALNHYRESVRINPAKHKAHYNLAMIYQGAGDNPGAILHYRESLKYNPGNTAAHYNLGAAYYSTGDFNNAALSFMEAIRIDPSNDNAHYNLAMTLQSMGSLNEAAAHYKEAIRLNPRSADAHYNLGVIYAEKNLLDEAETEFREALRIRPVYRDAEKGLYRVIKRKELEGSGKAGN